MAKVFIRFKSGFELPIICDELKIKTACGEILSYDIKGIKDNKPLFFRTEEVECIYQRMENEELKALPSAHRWIPCSEELPPYEKHVLTWWKGVIAIDCRVPGLEEYWLLNVEAWQPLPEPYEDGEIITQ